MTKLVDMKSQKQLIADAAIRVIDRTGSVNIRLRDVARAGNVTIGTVTHHFDNRDAVLAAAYAEVVRRTLDRIDMPFDGKSASDIPSYVERVCGYLPLDDISRGEWRVWLAFWGRAAINEQLRTMHRDYYETFSRKIAGRLQTLAGAPKGEKKARQVADALLAALDGVAVRATLEPGEWPAKRQTETLSALLTPLLETYCNK